MKKEFSKNWTSSRKSRKQRKYVYNIPKHLAKKLISVNLSKELRKKFEKRNIPVRKGDKVRVLTGKFRGRNEKISSISRKDRKIYLENIYNIRKDGTKTFFPINNSNLQITEISLDDKTRKKAIERK